MTKIIVDPGSCHYGKIDKAKKMIEVAAICGADAVKFQLFKSIQEGQNICLPYEWMPQLVDLGEEYNIEVFASVWDEEGMAMLLDCGCESIKFSYSERFSNRITKAIDMKFKNIYISDDRIFKRILVNFSSIPPVHVQYLFCVPRYPNYFKVNMDGLFNVFDGFSDHSLGIEMACQAISNGAKIIEKHFRLTDDIMSCPDSKIAITSDQLKNLCEYKLNDDEWKL